MARLVIATIAVTVAPGLPARADDSNQPSQWVGKKVVAKHDSAKIRIGSKSAYLTDPYFRTWIVEREDGKSLDVVSDDEDKIRGRVRAVDVIPVDQAIAYCNNLIAKKPLDGYARRAMVWDELKEHDRAIADWTALLKLSPRLTIAYFNRGLQWKHKKDFDSAIADFTKAIDLLDREPYQPRSYHFDAHFERGQAWMRKGDYARAIADFRIALRFDPKSADAHDALATILSSCPDGEFRDAKAALAAAKRACELSHGKVPSYFDTLAASYAEAGDFAHAVEWEKKAIELDKDPKHKAEYESRLALYQEEKPFRMPEVP